MLVIGSFFTWTSSIVSDPYVVMCDEQQMRPGDSCISSYARRCRGPP